MSPGGFEMMWSCQSRNPGERSSARAGSTMAGFARTLAIDRAALPHVDELRDLALARGVLLPCPPVPMGELGRTVVGLPQFRGGDLVQPVTQRPDLVSFEHLAILQVAQLLIFEDLGLGHAHGRFPPPSACSMVHRQACGGRDHPGFAAAADSIAACTAAFELRIAPGGFVRRAERAPRCRARRR
ncbi:MAG: hypothetical protein M5U09_27985, partial [Gammaproteobacteria bacterium]|nr:hypothetical protein [Gammaproteobacteria bacterium]